MDKRNNKTSMIQAVYRYWYLMLVYIVSSYALTQVVVDGSNRIAQATDSLFDNGTVELNTLLTPFLILTVIGTCMAFIKTFSQKTFSVNVQTDIKSMTTEKLVKLQYSYFDSVGTGTIMNKLIADVYQVEAMFSEVIPEMILSFITIVTVGVYIGIIDIRLLLVTMICYPVLLWMANVVSKKMGKLSGSRRALYDEMENTALDTFNGMIVGRSFNLREVENQRIDHVVSNILNNEYVRTRMNMISQVVGNGIRWVPRLLCYLFALYEVVSGHMTVGTLLSYVLLLNRIVFPLGELPGFLNELREELVSFRRINEIVKQPDELSGNGDFVENEQKPVIQLKDICFSYDGTRQIFNHLNLSVMKGQNVALVGSSGGGKSTVLKILCGFYLPHSGTYQLYGHDYEEWNISALRRQMALVSQDVFLFPGTIQENVAYGRDGATDEEVVTACKNANIHTFIMSLPEGYATQVGERGVKLSGGQRQRISIARAFLKNAPILMLDEPTSAVDVETEGMIQDAIDRISEGKTVLTIAHRLSTIEHADVIHVFDQGKIAESGTHEELLKQAGVYSSLYHKENEIMKLNEEAVCETVGQTGGEA